MGDFFGFLFIIAIIAVARAMIKGKKEQDNNLKSNYDRALKGTDKRAALEAGRAYYSSLRMGKLTIYDEQALANDIATMKTDTNP